MFYSSLYTRPRIDLVGDMYLLNVKLILVIENGYRQVIFRNYIHTISQIKILQRLK